MLNEKQQKIIQDAIAIIESTSKKSTLFAINSQAVKDYCQLQLAMSDVELFGALFLDNQHSLISFEVLFNGTINACSVYPREVVRMAIKLNAAAVIFTHNHPSGILEASHADKSITTRLTKALDSVDIRVLDHIIVSATGTMSFAETGLL